MRHDSERPENVCARVWQAEDRHYGRSTFICVCYASRYHQDVQDFERTLLVEWDEERDCKFRLHMSNLSAGEGIASEACREDTITPYSSMEMGEDHFGFCEWVFLEISLLKSEASLVRDILDPMRL